MKSIAAMPWPGPFQYSLDDVKDELVDLPEGAMQGLRSEQGGIDDVAIELEQSIPAAGDAAGISPKVHQRFKARTATIEKLRKHEAELAKALEVVRETLAKAEHDRENDVSLIVDAVKSNAQRMGDQSLLAAFQKTIQYNAQIAVKAAKTRKRNAATKGAVPSERPASDG